MARARQSGAWRCPTCDNAVATPYCPGCGERALQARDLSLRALFDQMVQAVSSVDGRLIRSLRYLVTRPGFLSAAYLRGQRKPYIAPLQLFLIANVLFFAMQSLTGARVFSTPLDGHLHTQMWSWLAQHWVTQRLAATQQSLEVYAPIFDQAVTLNAKSLIALMVVPFAVLPSLVFRRNQLPFVAHVVFALHFYAFVLLAFCVSLAVVGSDLWLGGEGLASTRLDHALSAIELLVCGTYLFLATGTVYAARGPSRVLKVAALAVAGACIVLGYRFVILLITLYTT